MDEDEHTPINNTSSTEIYISSDSFRRNIFLVLLIDLTTVGMVMPILPQMITSMTENDISYASGYFGFISSGSSFIHFLTSPLVGNLSDQFGRKKLILFSLFGNAFGYMLTFMSSQYMDSTGLFLIACSRITTGVTGHLKMLCYAYMSDIIDPQKRAQGFGLLGAAFGVGFFIGPAIGGILGSYSLGLPFFISFLLQLFCITFVHLYLRESLKKNEHKSIDHNDGLEQGSQTWWTVINPVKSLRLLFNTKFIFMLAFAMFLSDIASTGNHAIWVHYTSYRYQWKSFQSGLFFTIVGASTVFTQGVLIHYLIPKLGDRRCIYIGTIINTIVHVLIGITQDGWKIFCLIPFMSLASIAPLSIRSELSHAIKERHLQGSLQGSLGSMQKLSKVIGPLLFTTAFRYFAKNQIEESLIGVPFLLCAGIYGITIGIIHKSFKIRSNETIEPIN